MIDLLDTYISEPGFWVLSFLLGCALVTLFSSLLLRGKRKRLLALVNEIINEDKLNDADKAWLIDDIERSKGTHLLIAAPFAPFFILAALALSAYEGWSSNLNSAKPKDDLATREADSRKRMDALDDRIDTLRAKITIDSKGVDPRKGVYWNDKRRAEIENLSLDIETWNNPLAMMWIVLWLAAASPLMVVAYFASGSLRPFIINIWEPLRDPVLSVLSAARLKEAV